MSYHLDRFFAAVSVLAGHGHIKQRLIRAYEDNLADIIEDDLPASIRTAFADLKQHMYRVSPLNGEGPICASVRKMSIDEAAQCAASVVSLYGEIAGLKELAPHTLALEADARVGVPPPFLVKSN